MPANAARALAGFNDVCLPQVKVNAVKAQLKTKTHVEKQSLLKVIDRKN